MIKKSSSSKQHLAGKSAKFIPKENLLPFNTWQFCFYKGTLGER